MPLVDHNGLCRITLKRPFSDGTFAIDLDPLSLLSGWPLRYPPRCSTPFDTLEFWRQLQNGASS